MSPKFIARLKNIERLQGWCTVDKAIHLSELIFQHRPTKIVEIGVFGGRGAIAMGMACQEIGHGTVDGIDPWTAAAAVEGGTSPENDEWWAKLDYETIFTGADGARKALGVDDVVMFYRKHDTEVLPEYADGSIQLLHLDSNHSEAVSVRSVRDWAPKIPLGGFFIVDDSHWASQARAIELLRTDLGFEHRETREFQNDQGQIAMQYMVFRKL